jgi:hypothetical protein
MLRLILKTDQYAGCFVLLESGYAFSNSTGVFTAEQTSSYYM